MASKSEEGFFKHENLPSDVAHIDMPRSRHAPLVEPICHQPGDELCACLGDRQSLEIYLFHEQGV